MTNNPYARKAGLGPVGKKCKDCANLIKKEYHNRVYYKCKLIGNTNGPGTDVRLKWDACAFFVEKE